MKTRKDYEQELTYAIARHADAVERERASKEERMRAHEQLVGLISAVLDFGFSAHLQHAPIEGVRLSGESEAKP